MKLDQKYITGDSSSLSRGPFRTCVQIGANVWVQSEARTHHGAGRALAESRRTPPRYSWTLAPPTCTDMKKLRLFLCGLWSTWRPSFRTFKKSKYFLCRAPCLSHLIRSLPGLEQQQHEDAVTVTDVRGLYPNSPLKTRTPSSGLPSTSTSLPWSHSYRTSVGGGRHVRLRGCHMDKWVVPSGLPGDHR